MEKHCESVRRFGKEHDGPAARNEILESFIRDSGRQAYQAAYSLSGNAEEAHELVQETLYRVSRAWRRYEVSKPLDRWFFAILRNTFLDSRRRFDRRNGVSLDAPLDGDTGASLADLLASAEEGALCSLERQETAAAVRRALRSLNKRHRAVLKLCDMEGADYAETARALRVSLGTVRSRLFRARQAFQSQMAQVFG